jgi:hypothetical protein
MKLIILYHKKAETTKNNNIEPLWKFLDGNNNNNGSI